MIEEIHPDLFMGTLCPDHLREVTEFLVKIGSKIPDYNNIEKEFFLTARISGRWNEEEGFFFFEYYVVKSKNADLVFIEAVSFSTEEMPDEILDMINTRKKEHSKV